MNERAARHQEKRQVRAAIYVRISRDVTGEGLGVERQADDCHALAERLDWEVVGTYTDNDISAYSGRHRPEYRALLNAVRRREIDAIVTWHPDRMHRRPIELEEFITVVEEAGVAVRTVQAGELDLTTPSGRMNARIHGAVARHESEHKSQRIKRAMQQRAEGGKFHGGRTVPYGYQAVRVAERRELQLKPDPAAVSLLKEAARRILNGETLFGICNDWDARGLRTSRGAMWRSKTLKYALLNPAVIGKRSFKDPDTKEVHLHNAEWKPIMDQVTWDRLQEILTDPRRTWEPTSGSYAARLALGGGLTVCGLCGKKLVSQRHNGRSRLICHKQATAGCGRLAIDYAHLEEFVLTLVWDVLDTPEFRAGLGRRADTTEDVMLRDELRQIERLQDKNYDAFQDEIVDKERYLRRKAELDNRRDEVQARLADLVSGFILDAVPSLEAAQERWARGDVPWRRAFLSSVIRQVQVGPHPKQLGAAVHRRAGETDEDLVARKYERAHAAMRARLTIDWRS